MLRPALLASLTVLFIACRSRPLYIGTLADGGPPAVSNDLAPSAPVASGKFLNGRVFSWGPDVGMSSFKAGIIGNVVGYDSLASEPSTTIKIRIPIPQEVINDGKEHYVDLRGTVTSDPSNYPVLHTVYGPYVFTDTLLAESEQQSVFLHAILNQPGNIRDELDKEISATLGIPTKMGTDNSFIYGAFLDGIVGDAYVGSVITIASPPEAVTTCKVYYTCDFSMGGPCAAPGLKFLQPTSKGYGLFVVTCPKSVTGPIGMTATDGQDITDTSMLKHMPPISVPLSTGPDDVVFPEWRPLP
jgi:hypothetical protein